MNRKAMENVILMDLDDVSALKIVKDLAKDSANVVMTHHNKNRQNKRHVSDMEIIKCLRHGRVVESVHRTSKGNWKLTIQHYLMHRTIRVAVAIDNCDNGNYLIVVTVIVVT